MYIFAAAASHPTTADKLREIPTEFWLKMGVGVLIIIGVVLLLRKIAKVNKVMLGVGVLLAVTIIGQDLF